jgi:hypothetical protein
MDYLSTIYIACSLLFVIDVFSVDWAFGTDKLLLHICISNSPIIVQDQSPPSAFHIAHGHLPSHRLLSRVHNPWKQLPHIPSEVSTDIDARGLLTRLQFNTLTLL